MALTAKAIIKRALLRIGAIGLGVEAGSDLENMALLELNEMRDAWNAMGLIPKVRTRSVYTLTADDGEYTVGPSGATLTGPRPTHLEGAAIIANGQTRETDIDILTPQRYRAYDKTSTATIPDSVYVEPTLPNATVIVLPTPTAVVQLVLYTKAMWSSFANATTEYDYPEGYEAAFTSNLALRLCLPLGRPIPELLPDMATNAMANLKYSNESDNIPELGVDPALLGAGWWNGETGEVV
jgi:hypothetical protein